MADSMRKPADGEINRSGPRDGAEGDQEADFLATAKKRFSRVVSAESKNRLQAVEDLKFKAGEQWPQGIMANRNADNRPCLTVNKMKTFVHQVTNPQRQSRPAINISPVGEKGNKQIAKMLKGMIRAIERESSADVAYDTGFDNCVSNGFGYWRILTEYEGEDSFNQCIRVERIRNPFTVYLDPDRKDPTGADAKWGFISDLVPIEEFKEEFPDADDLQAWLERGIGDDTKEWVSKTHVRIAEYYVYETKMKELVALENGHIGYEDELAPALKEQIAARPEMVLKRRSVPCRTVKWYKITAKEILDEREVPGRYIPIVECVGDEVDVEGKVNRAGIVRDAKDAQRMYNYWVTSEAEMVALQPKAPFILEEGQIEGHTAQWRQANTKSYPYLLYKGTNIGGKQAPPPQRQPAQTIAAGVIQAKQGAAMDMQATTGLRFDGTKAERMADESGVAIDRLQQMGDIGAFHYIDNLGRSLKRTGEILVDLIPLVYDTDRVVTILGEDGTEEQVRINPDQTMAYAEKEADHEGRTTKSYNPKIGQYSVAVTIGPSYATRRIEASNQMIEFGRQFPQAAPLIQDLVAKNMDWPGADQIAARLAKALPPGLADVERSDLDPEVQALVQNLQNQIEQLTQQRDQAMLEVNSQDKDRAIQKEKNDNEFTAKLLKIAADLEIKTNEMLDKKLGRVTEMLEKLQVASRAENPLTGDEQRRAALNPMD